MRRRRTQHQTIRAMNTSVVRTDETHQAMRQRSVVQYCVGVSSVGWRAAAYLVVVVVIIVEQSAPQQLGEDRHRLADGSTAAQASSDSIDAFVGASQAA